MATDKITYIRFFNPDLEFLGEIRMYASLIFIRRWETIGEFEIHVKKQRPELFQNGNYIMLNNDPYRSGIIQYEKDDSDGYEPNSFKDITIKGYTLLYLLYRRITYPPETNNGYRVWTNCPMEDIMYDLVDENAINPIDTNRKIPHLIAGTSQHRGGNLTFQTRLKRVSNELNTLSVQSGLGVSIKLDWENKQLVFEVMEGVDRSYSESNSNCYIFKKTNGKVKQRTYTHSAIGASNMAYIGGQGDGADREIVTINEELTGLDRWETFIDARDIEEGETGTLVDRGKTKLAEQGESIAFEFEANPVDYRSMWDLGDLTTFYDVESGLVQDNRVTEVTETYEGSTLRIDPVFGHTTTTLSDAINTMASDGTTERTGISGKFKYLYADNAEIKTLVALKASIEDLTATNANIQNLVAEDARINNAIIGKATITDLTAATARIGSLETGVANIQTAIINVAHISDLTVINANIQNLTTQNATINNALILKANIAELTAATARITTLESSTANIGLLTTNVANIQTLLAGSIAAGSTQTITLNATNTTMDTAFIRNVIAANIAVGDLTAGRISTDKFDVGSDDGRLIIADQTIQIKDAARVRVQIGKDASADYNMYVWDASGNLMFDATGLKASGVKAKIIRDDMVSDTANISGSKLNMPTLIAAINGQTQTLKSSLVKYDPTGQTLEVVFGSLSTRVGTAETSISTNTTAISVANGKISTLISDSSQTISDLTTLTSNYNSTVATVSGIQTTIGNQQTTLNTATGNITSLQSNVTSLTTDLSGFKTTVSNTYVTNTTFDTLEIGGRNLLRDGGAVKTSTRFYSIYTADILAPYIGNKITVSFEMKVATARSINVYPYQSNGISISASRAFSVTSEYQRFKFTDTVKDWGINNVTYTLGAIAFYDGAGTNTLNIRNIKIEKGDKATDWTPAPEDIDASIATVDGKFTSYSTTTVMNSAIDQKANEITLSVSQTYATQTSLTTTNGLVTTAQTTANNAVTAVNSAQTTANTANSTANTATSLLNDLASDSKLTPVEKQQVKMEWDAIVSEKTINDTQATAFGIITEKTNYGTAYTTLSSYITSLLSSLTTTSDIVGTTFRANFKDYYDKRQLLLNAIATKAKALADTAQTAANTANATFVNYSTTTAMNSAIDISKTGILSTVSATYATQSSLTTVDGKFVNYSTTTAMNSAINQKASEITLSVSSTYATQEAVDEIRVAGRNLALNSGVPITTTAYLVKTLTLSKNIVTGQKYTVVLKGTIGTANYFGIWMNGGSNPAGRMVEIYGDGTSHTYIFQITAVAPTTGNEKILNIYTPPSNTTLKIIDWVCIYEGDIDKPPVDFIPAPEDADAKITTAQTTANMANSTANTAITNAATAQTTANTAKAYTDNLVLDSVITPDEKFSLKREWDLIVVEGTPTTGKIPVQATAFGVSDTAFDTAYSVLNTYLNTTLALFASMTTAETGVVRATWDTNFKNYYNARTDLLNAIAAKAKADAATAQTTANTATTNAATAQTTANTATTNLNNLTTRVSTAESKLTATSLITTITTGINGGTQFETTKFTMDNTGLTIMGGGLRVQNNAGTNVLAADTSGNLTLAGNVTLTGTDNTLSVKDTLANTIGSIRFKQITGQTWNPGAVGVFANNWLDLSAGNLNAHAAITMAAGGYTLIDAGYDTGVKYINIGTDPITACINIASTNSPMVQAVGATKDVDFTAASGFTKLAGYMNKIVYNGLGKFCFLAFTVSGSIPANTWTTILTLPVGYRPSGTLTYSGNNALAGLSQIRILSTGAVQAWGQNALSDISYTAFYYTI